MPTSSTSLDEAGRLQELRALQLPGSFSEPEFDNLTQLASEICDAPVALISFVDQDRIWFKSRVGFDDLRGPREHSFCSHAVQSSGPLVVEDATADPRFQDNAFVKAPQGIRFYAGIPLVLTSGHAVGTLCVFDYKARTLSDRQLGNLKKLALQVTSLIEAKRTALCLEEENRSRLAIEQRLDFALTSADALAGLGRWDWNLTADSARWSDGLYRIYGRDPADGVPAFDDWQETIHPEDKARLANCIQAALAGASAYHVEFRIFTKDTGQLRYIESRGESVVDANGKPTNIRGFDLDITERKRAEGALRDSEVRYKALVENAPVCIHELDLDGNLTSMNSSGLSMMGLNDQCQIQGLSYLAAVAEVDRSRIADLLAKSYSGVSNAFEFKSASEQEQYFQSCFVPIKDADGVVLKLMGITEDITARRQAQIELQSSVQEKSALLKEVHHRVKNNLQVITSLLRLEASRSLVADTKEVLGYMRGRIRTMAQLHESLYRAGTFASVDLGVYLGQVATQAFKTQELHHDAVRLTLNLGSVQSGMDQATAAGLLLNELISNCLKHGFPEGKTGEVSVALQPAHDQETPLDGRWCLRVSDTGVGLAPDFEDKSKASLGLQLVNDLSHQLGGTLVIDSVPGAGARFSVVFAVQAPAPLVMPP